MKVLVRYEIPPNFVAISQSIHLVPEIGFSIFGAKQVSATVVENVVNKNVWYFAKLERSIILHINNFPC
jgi:hypothetical protein